MEVGFFYGTVPPIQDVIPALSPGHAIFVFLVKNHGISEETIEAVISASRLFFSLPEVEKLKVGCVLVVWIF